VRVDVITIFPDWFAALDVSLTGKARRSGLLDLAVHDLRTWTHDRHRSVDDTPYGGGAGMVMRPEPWGEALDAVLDQRGGRPTLVVPTPSGTSFTQALARDLSRAEHLVFACGRYEGIDQRVIDEAATSYDVREISIGDYVLNGGEVATLAILEAVVRLLPGFMGNAESLVEESHEDGLLEYPVYTKPATWRGREVPAVLLSGDHAAIAAWRRAESVRRTVARRPDLAHPAARVGLAGRIDPEITLATRADAGELFTLTKACWLQEQRANPDKVFPAVEESLEDAVRGIEACTTFVARVAGRMIGSCRGRLEGDVWDIGRVMVAPDLQGRGLGPHLLALIEQAAPAEATSYALVAGARSADNIRMYKKAGYRLVGPAPGQPGSVLLTKPRR
jgi:tRNA (guanine37-N1)-methyltransferase